MSYYPSISLDSDDYEDTVVATQLSKDEESSKASSSQSSVHLAHEAINGTSLFGTGDLVNEEADAEMQVSQ